MIGLYVDYRKDGYHVIEGSNGEVESFSPVLNPSFIQQRYRELMMEPLKQESSDE